MCKNLFQKKVKQIVEDRREPVDPVQPPPVQEPAVPPAPTTPEARPEQTPSGLQTAQARIAGQQALDNAGLVAGEAQVDLASDGDAAEIDPATGRRRPTRASFMSQSRGGAGLKV